ncbi:MAG: nuclease A inhibitor family protein [Phormidesmis sp.]
MPAKDESTDSLKARLEDACKDLWWSSESDYPVEVVWQPQVETKDESLDQIDQWVASFHAEDAIEKVDLDDFFERATTVKSWHTKEDKDQISRLKQLKDLLTSELSHLQVYRCGEVEVAVYVLGYSDSGRSDGTILSGVQTILVET